MQGKFPNQSAFAVGTGRCGTHLLYTILREEVTVYACHEANPVYETFLRFARWNNLNFDLTKVYEIIEDEIKQAVFANKYYFEASAFLSLNVIDLYERFNAKIVFIIRNPVDTINSIWMKGWYKDDYRKSNPDLPMGYHNIGPIHHFFGRITPLGEKYKQWDLMTQTGKIAWFWNTLNLQILKQLEQIPKTHKFILKLEEFNYQKYNEIVEFLAIKSSLSEAKFHTFFHSSPGSDLKHRKIGAWNKQELQEVAQEVTECSRKFQYCLDWEQEWQRAEKQDIFLANNNNNSSYSSPILPEVPPASIIITLGAIHQDKNDIRFLINNGFKYFRINFARNIMEINTKLLLNIMELKKDHPIHLFVDFPGSKFRVGKFLFSASVDIGKDSLVSLKNGYESDNHEMIPVMDWEFIDFTKEGDIVRFSNSDLLVEILKKEENLVKGKTFRAGKVTKFGSLEILGRYYINQTLTKRELEIIAAIKKYDIDFFCLSFVDNKNLILQAREMLGEDKMIIAKIESPQGIINYTDILGVADGIMVGRDDLSKFYDLKQINKWIGENYRSVINKRKIFISASNYILSMKQQSHLSHEDSVVLSAMFEMGITICLNETSYFNNWKEAVLSVSSIRDKIRNR